MRSWQWATEYCRCGPSGGSLRKFGFHDQQPLVGDTGIDQNQLCLPGFLVVLRLFARIANVVFESLPAR